MGKEKMYLKKRRSGRNGARVGEERTRIRGREKEEENSAFLPNDVIRSSYLCFFPFFLAVFKYFPTLGT